MENACFIERSQKAKLNVLVQAVTDLTLLLAMIIGVLRLKSDSSIWRMLYRHVCYVCSIARHDLLPKHIISAGSGLDCTSYRWNVPASGASPPSHHVDPILIEKYIDHPYPKFKW